MHSASVFSPPAKTTSNCVPFGGSHSVNTLARSQSSAGWSLRFVHFTCQTYLTGAPSLGRCWECIKTVKMATVTHSWHSLHLGMISTFHKARACPKIIIPQPSYIASCCSLWLSGTTHLLSNLHLTFIPDSPPLGLSQAFLPISSGFSLFSLSLKPTIHLAAPLLHLLPAILFFSCLPPVPSALNSPWLNQASSATITILVWFMYFPILFYPFLCFSTHLSVYMSALSPFCQLIPVIYSIKWFCIPWVAAFLFYSPMSLCFSSVLSLYPTSILPQTSDKARE